MARMPKTEALTGHLSGEAFLQDFKKATELAADVDTFESWVLAGQARAQLIEQIKQNPVVADRRLAANGLAELLRSGEEADRMQDLVEEARELDVTRFLGYEAVVSAHVMGPITRYSVANPIATGARYLRSGAAFSKTKSAELTSISPANGTFRIGEFRNLAVPWRFTAFWEVQPFNEAGEPVVDVSLHGPQKEMPSPQYQAWWNANRA